MSLSILSNNTSVTNNIPLPFSAAGGVGPYTWSVIPTVVNGVAVSPAVQGTINSSTGAYVAPAGPNTGIDTIKVVDSTSPTPLVATVQISVCTILELICDIIQTQMGLSAGQVYVYNQKYNIPTDSRLYVSVGALTCKPFSNNNSYAYVNGSYTQVQSTNFQALLSIDILSRGTAARDQKEQIVLALGSNYAESQMELNSFNVALLPTAFTNLSSTVNLNYDDGPAIPYRFNISAQVQYAITKSSPAGYFNVFQQPAVSENV